MVDTTDEGGEEYDGAMAIEVEHLEKTMVAIRAHHS